VETVAWSGTAAAYASVETATTACSGEAAMRLSAQERAGNDKWRSVPVKQQAFCADKFLHPIFFSFLEQLQQVS
jgi:hypothetical protein